MVGWGVVEVNLVSMWVELVTLWIGLVVDIHRIGKVVPGFR